jgi:hypothetical protein
MLRQVRRLMSVINPVGGHVKFKNLEKITIAKITVKYCTHRRQCCTRVLCLTFNTTQLIGTDNFHISTILLRLKLETS